MGDVTITSISALIKSGGSRSISSTQDEWQERMSKCVSLITSYLETYARSDNSTPSNVSGNVENILNFAAGQYNKAQTAFAISNAIQETLWFASMEEPISNLCKSYQGGCDYRGRGYTHLTNSDGYRDIGNLLGVGNFFVEYPGMVLNDNWPVLTMDAYFQKSGILDLLSRSDDYLAARKKVNPGERLNKKIKGAKISKSLGDRLNTIAKGVAELLGECDIYIN